MVAQIVTVLFDGFAYGMLLFVLSVGLSVTLGLMNFANLAHGAFAMLGGYVASTLMRLHDWPFLATLPIAFAVAAVASLVVERLLYRRFYRAPQLEQVLLTIGIAFMSIAAASYIWGTTQQPVRLPSWLSGQVRLLGFDFGVYRLFLVGVGIAVTLALVVGIEKTRFGARIRAAVDNQRMARGLGIDVDRLFAVTFAIGGGLAGLGGALAIDMVGLDPGFALKYLIFFLIVVSVGGLGSIGGTFAGAALLGIVDVAGKYYVPAVGSFILYSVMILLLAWRPMGLFGKRA